jgi:hypothetical protein
MGNAPGTYPGKEKIKETDRRNSNWFAFFYLLPPVFEMKQTFRRNEIHRFNVFSSHSLSFLRKRKYVSSSSPVINSGSLPK